MEAKAEGEQRAAAAVAAAAAAATPASGESKGVGDAGEDGLAPLWDIGVNLTCRQLRKRVQQVLDRAGAEGVTGIVGISNSFEDIRSNQALVERFGDHDVQVWMTAGVHPHHADEMMPPRDGSAAEEDGTAAKWAELETVLRQTREDGSRVVAVGECGLDWNRNFSSREGQLSVFERQIELAKSCGKPLYVHEREAFDDVSRLLDGQAEQGLRAVVHCFTGNRQQLEHYQDAGFSIGITTWICDPRPRSADLVDAVESLDLSRLLLETDSPFLKPPQVKGKSNFPSAVKYVAQKIAELTGHTEAEVRQAAAENTATFFGV